MDALIKGSETILVCIGFKFTFAEYVGFPLVW